MYCLAKKKTKKVVSEACNKTYEKFYKELGTKAEKSKIYKIAIIRRENQETWTK